MSTLIPARYATDEGLGFYRSDDGGENWTRITNDPRPAMKIGGGDLPIPKVDPKNPDIVYSASIVTVRSSDGGKTWESIRGAPGGDDYQNIWINPDNPDIILLVSRSGRAGHGERRQDMEFLVQPAHCAALSRHYDQHVSI